LSEKTGLSERSIRTSLKRLKSTSEVTIRTTNKFSIVTLCNYDIYNPESIEGDQQNASTAPTNDQQATTNKNDKNEKNIIPPIFEHVSKYCEQRKNDVDARRWYDFYESKNWMIGKNKMKDWHAAVRTWEKKKRPTNKPKRIIQ